MRRVLFLNVYILTTFCIMSLFNAATSFPVSSDAEDLTENWKISPLVDRMSLNTVNELQENRKGEFDSSNKNEILDNLLIQGHWKPYKNDHGSLIVAKSSKDFAQYEDVNPDYNSNLNDVYASEKFNKRLEGRPLSNNILKPYLNDHGTVVAHGRPPIDDRNDKPYDIDHGTVVGKRDEKENEISENDNLEEDFFLSVIPLAKPSANNAESFSF